MKPFRERNPVIIGAISIAVMMVLLLGAFRAQDLPLIGGGDTYTAAFTEAGGLKADDPVRIAGVRVGKVETIELDGDHVQVTFKVKTDSAFGKETAPRSGSTRCSAPCTSRWSRRAPASSTRATRSRSSAPARRSTSSRRSPASPRPPDAIDTDQLAQSLTTLADLTRNTPEEFRAALSGVSRLSQNVAAKNDRISLLLTNLQRVSTVLNERDEDIVDLMRSPTRSSRRWSPGATRCTTCWSRPPRSPPS